MSQVVTELVIDANTSGADRYVQSMQAAEDSTTRTMHSIAGLGNSFSGLAATFATGGAIVAGIVAITDYVAKANKELADMETISKRVGLSLADFQGVKFGGMIAGLSSDQINSGLEKSAQLLNDASRNSNTLSKELAGNGVSIRNSNGSLITQNQLLGVAADLISRAKNPGDAKAIAEMLGFTKEWVPLLEQGVGKMNDLTGEAQKAGAVIDDEIIKRATKFDQEWRKSSIELSAYMKSALVGLLPYVDDLINGLQKFIKGIDTAKIEKFAQEQLSNLADPIGLPNEAAVRIEIPQNVKDGWNDVTTSIESAYNWLKKIVDDPEVAKLLSGNGDPSGLGRMVTTAAGGSASLLNISRVDPKTLPGYDASQITEPSYPSDSAMDHAFAKAKADRDAAAAARAKAARGFSTVVADDTNDAIDTAIKALQRRTEAQKADTEAIGQGVGAVVRLKSEHAELAARLANGGKETAEQAELFKKWRLEAEQVAIALERARIANDISRGNATRFLSQDDVNIANQLKGLYPDVATALGSVEAQALRANTAFRGISTTVETTLVSGLTDIAMGTKNAGTAFQDMSKLIIRAIEEMIIKMLVIQPLMRSIQGVFGGSSGPITLGNSSGPTAFANANGNIFDGGNVIPFARGGVIDSPMLAPMALMGEAGPEAIVPLKRGSDGSLGLAGGGGNVTVNAGDTHIVVQGSADEKTLAIMDQKLAARDANLHQQVVGAVTQAKKMRQL